MTTESMLALARIIARQEQEIAGLKQTLASTAQVAADAEKREADAATAELLHKQEWSKSLSGITPDSLRSLADGLANQNAHAESVAARYAASGDMREALRDLLALHQGYHHHPTHALARKALAKAERAEP